MTALEAVAWGYGLLEGPRFDAAGNLFFSDVPNGGVYCLAPDGTVSTAIPKRRGVGGISLHADGGLVVSGRNIVHVRDGVTRVLFDGGVPGYNDLIADPAGRVICGTLRADPFAIEGERTPGEAWRIDAEGSAVELYGGIGLTNGIGFSPDATVIYHADTSNTCVWAHDYDVADGSVSNRRALVQRDDLQPDGIAVDAAGNVWVADVSGSRSVRAFGADGTEVARVAVPSRMVTSICFGGADGRDVAIVTADNTEHHDRLGTVYRARFDTPGAPTYLARI